MFSPAPCFYYLVECPNPWPASTTDLSPYQAQARLALLGRIQEAQLPVALHHHKLLPLSVVWMHLRQQIQSVHSILDLDHCSTGENISNQVMQQKIRSRGKSYLKLHYQRMLGHSRLFCWFLFCQVKGVCITLQRDPISQWGLYLSNSLPAQASPPKFPRALTPSPCTITLLVTSMNC